MPAAKPCQHIRAVIFDAVGTLIHPEPGAATAYAAAGRRHGSRLTVDDIRPRFAAAFRREEERDRAAGWLTSEDRERTRWQTIVATVLDDVPDPAACFADLFAYFSQPSAWRCEPELVPVLQALADRGYPLGLASNFDRRLHRVLAGLALAVPLAPVLVSSEVGWRKPSERFYAELCRTVGLPPAEILLVGDDAVNDYAGARQAGLQAVLFDPRATAIPTAVERIARLSDLLALLPGP